MITDSTMIESEGGLPSQDELTCKWLIEMYGSASDVVQGP